MKLSDLLIKYSENFDIKDRCFELTSSDCEFCREIKNEFCNDKFKHSIRHTFKCINCKVIINFYELGIKNYSRVHITHGDDEYCNNYEEHYNELSCAQIIIKSIIE